MKASPQIASRVTKETKVLFKRLAQDRHVTESVLLKRLISSALAGMPHEDSELLRPGGRELRSSRVTVRLHPDDRRLIRDRAAARQMAVATYISVLVRAHARALSPLPKAELETLKRSVAEVGAIGRNINQLAHAANSGRLPNGPTREELLQIVRVCSAMRDHIKEVTKANAKSWISGDEDTSR